MPSIDHENKRRTWYKFNLRCGLISKIGALVNIPMPMITITKASLSRISIKKVLELNENLIN